MGSSTKSLIKDIIIIVVAIAIIWLGLQAVFGTANPFYVVSSGSMIPVLQIYDVIVVEGNTPFEDIEKGDIIVFYSPKLYEQGKERVIVHRVSLDMSTDAQKIVRTKGDANPSSNCRYRLSYNRKGISRSSRVCNTTSGIHNTNFTTTNQLHNNCSHNWSHGCETFYG